MDIMKIFNHIFSIFGVLFFLGGFVIGFCFFSGRIKSESEERGDTTLITILKVIGVSLAMGLIVALAYAVASI